MINKQEYEIINKYKDELRTAVEKRYMSSIPAVLLKIMEPICKRNRIEFCSHCNGTLLRAFSFILNELKNYELLCQQVKQKGVPRKQPQKKNSSKD